MGWKMLFEERSWCGSLSVKVQRPIQSRWPNCSLTDMDGKCYNIHHIVEEWKTNLMSLAILFHFLCAQHVSDINISIFRSLQLCCWITTSVILFCKNGWIRISVNLRCIVVCVWCDAFCRLVVIGGCILIDFDRYMRNTTHKRTQWSQKHNI
jgi:hypothetical protein